MKPWNLPDWLVWPTSLFWHQQQLFLDTAQCLEMLILNFSLQLFSSCKWTNWQKMFFGRWAVCAVDKVVLTQATMLAMNVKGQQRTKKLAVNTIQLVAFCLHVWCNVTSVCLKKVCLLFIMSAPAACMLRRSDICCKQLLVPVLCLMFGLMWMGGGLTCVPGFQMWRWRNCRPSFPSSSLFSTLRVWSMATSPSR